MNSDGRMNRFIPLPEFFLLRCLKSVGVVVLNPSYYRIEPVVFGCTFKQKTFIGELNVCNDVFAVLRFDGRRIKKEVVDEGDGVACRKEFRCYLGHHIECCRYAVDAVLLDVENGFGNVESVLVQLFVPFRFFLLSEMFAFKKHSVKAEAEADDVDVQTRNT